MTTRDVENLQTYSGGVLATTVFQDYCEYLVRGGREDTTGSFHGFLIHRYRGRSRAEPFVTRKVQGILKEMLALMEKDAARENDEAQP